MDTTKENDNGKAIVRTEPTALAMRDVKALAKQRSQFAEFVSGQLVKDVHYGVIPGTGTKPTLLKPGAEEVARLYTCTPTYQIAPLHEDYDRGLFAYRVKCIAVDSHGIPRAEGDASCSSYESKYRYRTEWWREQGAPPASDGWRVAKRGGGYMRKIENEDLCDTQNTVLKMACKRALVAAALNLGCCSEYFTQDIEDLAHIDDDTAQVAVPARQPAPPTRIDDSRQEELGDIGTGRAGKLWALAFKREEKMGAEKWACSRAVFASRGIKSKSDLAKAPASNYQTFLQAIESWDPGRDPGQEG